MKTVLFLCTGNYYRSRYAEAFFNWQAERRQAGWRADSRGLLLYDGNPGCLSSHTSARLRELGIPLAPYERRPLPVSHNDFATAHQVIAVKGTEHRPMIAAAFPRWLPAVEFWEIHDLDCALPHETLSALETAVLELLDRLTAGEDPVQSR